MTRLTRADLEGPTPDVARRLLGMRLVHDGPEGRCSGRIVETEAYLAEGDAACHAHGGRTARNASMFLAPGHAYVYLIYGVHLCFNVVTGPRGVGEAVLVRALEPLEGLERMRARRGGVSTVELCNGPGKLVQALGIGRDADGASLMHGKSRLLAPTRGWSGGPIEVGPRVGITRSRDLALRCYCLGSPFVSRAGRASGRLQRGAR